MKTVHNTLTFNNQPPDAFVELANDEYYLGWCARGCTGTDDPKWIICHISADAGLGTIRQRTWAEGCNTDFSLVFDDYLSYTYTQLV